MPNLCETSNAMTCRAPDSTLCGAGPLAFARLSRIDAYFEALNNLLDASGALESEPLQFATYALRLAIARAANDSPRVQAAELSLQQMNSVIADFNLLTFDGWVGAAKAMLAEKPSGTALDDSGFQGYLVLVQGSLYAIPSRALENYKVQTEWGIPIDAYEPDQSIWSNENQAWEAHDPVTNRDVLLMPKFVSLEFQELTT